MNLQNREQAALELAEEAVQIKDEMEAENQMLSMQVEQLNQVLLTYQK